VLLVLFFDQITKYWITDISGYERGVYPPYGGQEIIGGVFNLVYSINPGAAWGILAGHGWIFIIIAVLALLGIFLFRTQLELDRIPYQIVYGLIIGGIIGNTIDRVRFGYVIDFLDVDLQFYRWPTFNIADSGIVVGTMWMIIFSQFLDRPRKQKPHPSIMAPLDRSALNK